MKTGNRGIFSTTSKVIGVQANWKRRASKGNELTKRILSVGGVKTQTQWQETLTTVASSYVPEVSFLFLNDNKNAKPAH